MHRDEVTVDETVVRGLLAEQFPAWAGLPLEPIEPPGTDNWLFRLGAELLVRLPCRERTVATLVRERTWLPRFAGRLPLEIPLPVAAGKPGAGYPWTWSVYRWLEGENAIDAPVADLARAAVDLAALLEALQRVDQNGGPGPGEENFFRGAPLGVFDPRVRADLAQLRGDIDVAAATAVWEAALRAPDRRDRRCGFTATSTGATCSRGRDGWRRSSTSAVSVSVTRRAMWPSRGGPLAGDARQLPQRALGRRSELGQSARLGGVPGARSARVLHARDEPDPRRRGAAVAGGRAGVTIVPP